MKAKEILKAIQKQNPNTFNINDVLTSIELIYKKKKKKKKKKIK